MKTGRKIAIIVGIALIIAVTAALTSLAEGTYGSRTDPLVTLSYINETVVPEVNGQLDEIVGEYSRELSAEFEEKLAEERAATGQVSQSEKFNVVSLSNGQTLKCAVGTEIMLRIGTAVSAGPDSPRLIDETTGGQLSAEGAELTVNHMYMVTIRDNGIKATSAVKVLVRGDYTIS